MAASDISRQIAETEKAFLLREEELETLNKRIERLQQKRDKGEALTDDEKADMTEWKAERIRVRQSSDLLTQRLERLAAAQGESCCSCCWVDDCLFCGGLVFGVYVFFSSQMYF